MDRHDNFSFETTTIREGLGTILIPVLTSSKPEHVDRARSRAPVFYNPRMSFNRDSAILALGAHQKKTSKPVRACEPMCGTGVRGVRMALEVEGVERVIMGDLNPRAIESAKKNASLNGVSKILEIIWIEANLLLSSHAGPYDRFDYIDLDPYGSPARYLDSAVRSCKTGGLLALTATDMGPLCGVNPLACLRKYGGIPLRTEYCHETAIRLLTGSIVKSSAKFDIASIPVFSFSVDHYVRCYVKLIKGAKEANQTLKKIGYLLHCFRCSERTPIRFPFPMKSLDCDNCGSEMKISGPLWLGELSDEDFCSDMLETSEKTIAGGNKRLLETIGWVKEEIGFPPGFYNVDKFCSKLKLPSIPLIDFLSRMSEAGFKSVRSHVGKRGFKTDASISEIEKVLEENFSK